jgi:hypothetical protein
VLFADDIAPPSDFKEDPVSIFSSKLGDQDVELLLQGSWRLSLSGATGIRFGPDSSVIFPYGHPAFGNGFFFEQVPALTFSLVYAERYFLEVSVLAHFEDNTILGGYRGKPGEFVQNVLIGNKETKIGTYDFIDVPDQSKSSLGASALFTTPFSSHELLLRYDATREAKKVFLGKGEVSETTLSPADFLHGSYFMLPDAAVVGLVVYLEDKNGAYGGSDGKHYRQATTNEIFQDVTNGFLYILQEFKGRVLVYYTKTGSPIGTVGLGLQALPWIAGGYIDPTQTGTDFNWGVTWNGEAMTSRRITVNSQTCLLLWEPGKFSPFEMLSAYDLGSPAPNDVSTVRIKLIPAGAPESTYPNFSTPVYFNVVPGLRFFTVYADSNTRGNFQNHYPFPDGSPLHQLYGPARDHIPPYFEYDVFVQMPTGYESYVLDSNIVPGSIRVQRNGNDETRFTYNKDSYTLTFTTPIYPYDRIEVFYRVSVPEKNAGDVLFAWGNRFPFSPMASLDLALGLRWNILPGAYTEHAYSKTGALVVSGTLSGKSDFFSYKIAGAVSYTNPDTTGIMRLAGMEGHGIMIEPGEDLCTPSATLTAAESAAEGIPLLGSRGSLLYKDYRQYDSLGGAELKPVEWSPPASQIWSYTTGSKPGPYLVAGNSESSHGQSLVFDFELAAATDWVGIQIPFAYKNGVADLSKIKSIIASLRAVNVSGDFNVYIQAGACNEDIDGDGILEEEYSTLAGGYPFHDGANTLLVGGGPKNQGNNIINSEDIDGNGSLDPEDRTLIFSGQIASFIADAGWNIYPLLLSGIDQEKLKRVRAFRIIIVANAATTGRLLVDKILLSGSSFWSDSTVAPNNYSSFSVREVSEGYISAPPLQKSFSDVKDVFHADGSEQDVLDIDWSGGTGVSGWTVKSVLGTGSEGIRYRNLVFYAYRPLLSNFDLSFTLKDLNGKGVLCTILDTNLNAFDGSWMKITLDLFDRSVTVNGVVTPASITVNPGYGSLLFFSLSVANSNSGTLLIDEIHLRDPEGRVGAALAAMASYEVPGPLLSAGNVPILSDFSIKEDVSLLSQGFGTLYSRPSEATGLRSATVVKANILFADIAVDVLADSLDWAWNFSGGHSLTFPTFSSPVVFFDRYTLLSRSLGEDFSRENSLKINLPPVMNISLGQSAYSSAALLKQAWTGNLSLTVLSPYQFVFNTGFSQSSADFSLADNGYLASWIQGYQYLIPWTGGGPLDRGFTATLTQSLLSVPLGAELTFVSGYTSFDIAALSHRQKDTSTLALKIPIKIDTLLIEPGYSRTLSAQHIVNEAGDLGRDLSTHFAMYGVHDYFFASLPFYEIVSPDYNAVFISRTDGLEMTSYKPEITLAVTRPFGSRLVDLFIPSKIAVFYGKEYVMQSTLFNAYETLSVNLLFNAINLFGSAGAYRLTDLYAIDNFATSLKTEFSWREDRSLYSALFSLESAYAFEAEKGNKLMFRNLLSLENKSTYLLTDKGGIDFTWLVFPKEGVALPLISEEMAKKGYFAHKESVEFQFNNLASDTSSHPISFIIKHESSIQYPEFGYLRGEIAFGFDWESDPEQGLTPAEIVRKDIVITGIRLTIELNVKF